MQLLNSETPENYEFQIPAPNLLYKNTFRLTFTLQLVFWAEVLI